VGVRGSASSPLRSWPALQQLVEEVDLPIYWWEEGKYTDNTGANILEEKRQIEMNEVGAKLLFFAVLRTRLPRNRQALSTATVSNKEVATHRAED